MSETMSYTPLRELGPDYRLGRCTHCANKRVYVWHKDTGLRLDDVRCPRCKHLLNRTSREAHGYRFLDASEISYMRQDALDRYEISRREAADAADSWIAAMETASGSELYRCELNADRYLKTAKHYADAITRLEKAT